MMKLRERLALERKVELWLAAGGVKALFEIQRRAEEEKKAIREALQPDPETLSQPMTI